jgi:biopolymer transport protein ExbD
MPNSLRNKRNQEGDYIADINVTPFVDVLLVLLIMFMVVAATPLSKINVKLPDGENNKKITSIKNKKLVITIKKDKNLYFSDKKTTIDEILKKLSMHEDKKEIIYIKADKELGYGLVMKAINDIKSSNFHNISLVTYQ